MLNSGGIIISCIAANTIVNLFYPIKHLYNKICAWWKRLGKFSVIISRDGAYVLFKNIAQEISPFVGERKTIILSFTEQTQEGLIEKIARVPFPNEIIKYRYDRHVNNFSFCDIVSIGEGFSITAFEILFEPSQAIAFKKFLSNLPIPKKTE